MMDELEERARRYADGYTAYHRQAVKEFGPNAEQHEREIQEAARIGGLLRQARTRVV